MERWLPVVGYENRYEVSDHGRVRNTHTGVIRKQSVGRGLRNRGRCSVDWNTGGRKEHFAVHRLVLEAFIGSRPKGAHACHRDDNPSNNNLDNLYWGSPEENIADKVRNKNRHRNHPTCKWGHDFDGVRPGGARSCSICTNHKHRLRQGYYVNHPDDWPSWLSDSIPGSEFLLDAYRKAKGRSHPGTIRNRDYELPKRVV